MRRLGCITLLAGASSLAYFAHYSHSENIWQFLSTAQQMWQPTKTAVQCEETNKTAESEVFYSKVFIFIRHGQYNLKGRTADEKILTNIGWKQAYEAGRYLKRSGIKIDRIIHSDMIRARQTTAGILVGLQDECETLMDLPILTHLASPVPTSSTAKHPPSSSTVGVVPENTSMLGEVYSPYPQATFDCQESRFLTEGPPPVAPEPPSRQGVEEAVRSSVGRRLETGFLVHIHHIPVTLQGLRSFMTSCDPSTQTTDPCETIVFVGHANVFRFWLCRALQLPAEAWLRFSLGHGSISSIVIEHEEPMSNLDYSPAGSSIFVDRIGEVGHLPASLLTR